MVTKLVIIGIQGSGKSTQGKILSSQLHLPYLSSGHIFRDIAKRKTPQGRYIKETLNSGMLVPDDKTIEIVEEYLTRPEYKNGYVLDGFPRTLKQAKAFTHNVDKVVFIDLPEKDALWRIAGRDNEERDDETLAGVHKRIELFYKVTMPVVEFYKEAGLLVTADGTGSIEEINKEVLLQLGKELVGEKVHSWSRDHKTIIAIVGLLGSGKSQAGEYFKEKELPIVSFGKVINDFIDKNNLDQTEEVHKKVRLDFRREHGIEALAVLNKEKIEDHLKKSQIVIVEGLGSYEEKQYLEDSFKDVDVVVICVWAEFAIRAARIEKRKYRGQLYGRDRDINEVVSTNRGPTHALCDFMVINDGSIEDLNHKLENIYREIYYS